MDPTVPAPALRPRRGKARKEAPASETRPADAGGTPRDCSSAPSAGDREPRDTARERPRRARQARASRAGAETAAPRASAAPASGSTLGKADAERLAAAILRVLRSLIAIAIALRP